MNAYDRYANLYAKLPGMGNLWARRIVAFVVGLMLLSLLTVLLVGVLPLLPARFWQLLGLCAVAAVVLWWFAYGAKRYSRSGFSRKRIGDLGPGNPEDEREPLARMAQALAEARSTILRSPEIEKGRNPIYRVPWMLFIGDEAANVPGLLRAANEFSAFPPPAQPDNDSSQVWRWWFFKSLIGIEMHPRIVCDNGARTDRGLWYQALNQLANSRDRLPVNGIAVCIAAPTLVVGGEELKAAGQRLRRLVDEALEHLQVDMPVYFLVTGLEQLPGYAAWRAALPAESFTQALGYRLPETAVISAATQQEAEGILQPILDRLHALRMSALRAQATADGRRGVYEFVEALRKASAGLRDFIASQLEDNPFQRTPRWRGLYFTGAGGGAQKGGAFVGDLFTRFLPADQPLAVPSFRGKSVHMGVAGLGVLAMLGLSAYLSYGLVAAHRDDGRLLAQTRVACRQLQDAGAGNRIASLANCGRTIRQLQVNADRALLGFGIRRADANIERLKAQIVDDFQNLILAPYDQALETDLAQGHVGFEHVLAVTQRLRMVGECRHHSRECEERELPHNAVFDPGSRLYAPFASALYDASTRQNIAAAVSAHADVENAAALMQTYLGYLRWQKSSVLDAEEERLRALLVRVLAAYSPTAQDIEQWARAHGDGVTLAQFWQPGAADSGAGQPAIPAAYTLELWSGVMQPALRTALIAAPEKKKSIDELQDRYFSAYFRSWSQFQARFFEGQRLWHGRYDELSGRIAGGEDPYRQFFAASDHHLFGLPLQLSNATRWSIAWAGMRSHWAGAWRPLSHYVQQTVAALFQWHAVTPPPWLQATKQTEMDVLAAQQALYSQAYLRLGSNGNPQDLYQMTADLYRNKGVAQQPPGATYTALLQSVDKPDDRFASLFAPDDFNAWAIVQGPSRLLLFLTVYRAGEFVQAKWHEGVYLPLHQLQPRDQQTALYGDNGRFAAFVADWLRPFVSEHELSPVKLGGIAMPLSPQYDALVAQATGARSQPGGKPFLLGALQFTAPSQFGSALEGAQGTQIDIACQDRVYSASSHAESLAEATVSVFWSPDTCTGATLRIALPAPPSPPPPPDAAALQPGAAPPAAPAPAAPGPRLTRIYNGADGIAALIADFRTGSQRFALGSFQSAYTAQQWNELVPQLRALNTRDVLVSLSIQLSDDMQRYLSRQNAQAAALPESILD
jgi:hypothetical protein